MTACPNSTAGGCRCPQHDPGLSAHAHDPVAYEQALKKLRPTRLHIVTMGLPGTIPCNGTMTCPCEDCVKARVTRPALGAGPAEFKVRPARRRAA